MKMLQKQLLDYYKEKFKNA